MIVCPLKVNDWRNGFVSSRVRHVSREDADGARTIGHVRAEIERGISILVKRIRAALHFRFAVTDITNAEPEMTIPSAALGRLRWRHDFLRVFASRDGSRFIMRAPKRKIVVDRERARE